MTDSPTGPTAPPLAELLAGYRVTALRLMCELNGWADADMNKDAMVRRLAARFADPEHPPRALAALDKTARAALEAIQRLSGEAEWDDMASDWVADGLAGKPREVKDRRHYYNEFAEPDLGDPQAPGRVFQDVLARLELRGLVLGRLSKRVQSTVVDFGAAQSYVIPAEVHRHLPPPPPSPPPPPPSFEREARGEAAAFSRELFLVWSYVRRHRPSLLNTGYLSKRDLKALATQWPEPVDTDTVKREDELAKLHFERLLLGALALVVPGSALEADEPRAVAHWGEPLPSRAALWLAAWRDGRWWNELQRLPGVRWRASGAGAGVRAPAPEALVKARRLVVERLGRAGAAGEWVGLAGVVESIRRSARDFLVARRGGRPDVGRYNYSSYGYRTPSHRYTTWTNAHDWQFDGVRDERHGWEVVEGDVIRQVAEILHWLGLVDTGVDAKGAVVACRLTPIGRHVLAGGPAPAEADESGARVVVQPNFHILAFGPVAEVTLLDIERFADRVGTDRALEYRLTRESVYRAQTMGWAAADVIARLADIAGAELAQNVSRSIEEWQHLHERIVIHRRARLVQAADADLLTRLVADAPAALAPVAPSLARAADAAGLMALLGRHDVAPTTRHDPQAAGGVVLAEDGAVAFRQKVPDLFVLGQLQRLATWDAPGGVWRLTHAAVQHARQRHTLDAPAQIEAWARLLAGPAPAWLEQRVKAWSGHYAPARVHRRWLIELPDDQTFKDLRADPRLASRLKRWQPKGPLVPVDEESLEALREILAEYGIEVRGG